MQEGLGIYTVDLYLKVRLACSEGMSRRQAAKASMMEMEVEAHTGAAPGARFSDRKTYRNGYRERVWGEAE